MQQLRQKLEHPSVSWVVLGLCALYCCLFSYSYLSDPLALAPQLDARENLTLAEQIDHGTLAEEPIYRAMLYPVVLSLFPQGETRITLGILFGLACHLLNGFLVYRLAGLTWRSSSSATLSAALYLLNPASIFFALQLLDATFAIALFLSGLLIALEARGRGYHILLCGLLIGLSALARPHFLPVVLLLPAVLAFWPGFSFRLTARAWIPVLLLLLLQGTLNQQHAGAFRILPWQGSFNLWAANRPGANGLYFKQSMDMSARGEMTNPAREESIALYARTHPDAQPPFAIKDMNRYWKGKFLTHLTEDPVSLVKLCLFKAYAAINSFEQYNNLTVSFHKARLPWLRYNPLNWGILFILATGGGLLLMRQHFRIFSVLLLLVILYGSALLIYYASARFRLPLVPLVAVLGGGIALIPGSMRRFPGQQAGLIAAILLSAAATYSSFFGIHSTDTYIQDQLLLANANADLGRDAEAAAMSKNVLEKVPDRAEALRIYSISYFNLRLLNHRDLTDFGDWDSQRALVIQSPPTDTVQDAILGVYYWKWGMREDAIALWEQIAPLGMKGSPMAAACLSLAQGKYMDQDAISALGKALKPILRPAAKATQP